MSLQSLAGVEIWNCDRGWCLSPFPVLQAGEMALAVEPGVECDEWTVDRIAFGLGYSSESRYLGENNLNQPLETEVYQFIAVYSDKTELKQAIEELLSGGIPQHLFRIVTPQGVEQDRANAIADLSSLVSES
jgi:hypothetical protein